MSYSNNSRGARPRVVIVGAGFGGLSAVRALARSPVDTLIIDRNNYHTFHALLYQVAAAELEPEEISYPVRTILRGIRNASFLMGQVERIDLDAKTLKMASHVIHYDYLILAAGSTTRFFGVAGAPENAFELKTLDHAIALRNHILCCLEQAGDEADAEICRRLLTFVIIGGGPTGVEFAGALAELMRGPIMKDYPALNPSNVRVVLLQAVDSVLPDLPSRLRNYALRRLRRMGIEVLLSVVATHVTPEGVYLKDGSFIPSRTVVWTAGVRGDGLAETSDLPVAGDSRVQVLPSLQVPGHPEAYAIGDFAHVEIDGHPLPFTAPPAIQEGAAAALNIKCQLENSNPLPFQYRDKGSLATIGRVAAVAYVGRHEFKGFGAWALWLGVHIFNLIGFRNRILVMVDWAWDFLLYERAVRLILPSESCSALRERTSSRMERTPEYSRLSNMQDDDS
jgi:NADH:ubiquinone reductase (H+-translocating)